jgi:hypothetical protein
MALAAFYIVPAAYERRYVQIALATVADMRIDHNFLFEHTGSSADALIHDQVLHTASLIAVILLAATLLALVSNLVLTRRQHASAVPAGPLMLLTCGIAFMLTSFSLQLWNCTPQVLFLQFPWRLLLVVAPILAIATASFLDRFSIKFLPTVITATALAIALSQPSYRNFRQACDVGGTPAAIAAQFHSNNGTDPTDEYTPTDADNDILASGNPPHWLASSPEAAHPAGMLPGPTTLHFAVESPRAQHLILNLRDYPAWRIELNHAADYAREHRPDGLIVIPVPAGTSTVDVDYAHTRDQTVGDSISLLAGMITLLVARSSRRKGHRVSPGRRPQLS